MPPANVSSCVLSIIASFTSGLDVFKKFREARTERKRRRPKKNASVDDEEKRLARSLRQGPEDIGREYQRSIQAAGQDFANGDAIAHTSLAEILLKLNTGLVSIINSFLAKGKDDIPLDYRSLTSLSEKSRLDTCRILQDLLSRMMHARVPAQVPSRNDAPHSRQKPSIASPRRSSKVRGPTLARVVIADSSRPSQVAFVRPGERKKKSMSPVGSSKMQSTVSLAQPTLKGSQSMDEGKLPALPVRPEYHRSQTLPSEHARLRHKQSAVEIGRPRPQHTTGRDVLRATQSTSRLNNASRLDHELLPPLPRTAPLPTKEPRIRKPTPTYYSIESNSTKLGEIPLHKWAEPYDFDTMSRLNHEAERNGWPFNDLDNTQERKRRGLGIFRLFRRNRDTV